MAFSHDKFTFLIICFIIPQLIIVQAQSRAGDRCETDRDCLSGQICDKDRRCYDEFGLIFWGAHCESDGGKFLLFSNYKNSL